MDNKYRSISIKTRLNSKTNRLIKRIFDVILSLIVLFFIFPWVYIVVAIIIKSTMPGTVFFKQKRTGLYGKTFVCYKFRTMIKNEEADTVQATIGDSRITRWGKVMRISSVDEFPQFWNVLKGDMSIVGPRPHMLAHTEQYSKEIQDYDLRLSTKPGITGWAQINGYRGEITQDKMKKRIEHDIWYITNWSFGLDFKIILRTVKLALFGS